jgi:hypothetical protein
MRTQCMRPMLCGSLIGAISERLDDGSMCGSSA